MTELYPPIEPYEQGHLDVGDGQSLYWEASGNPRGRPAVVLHGGPGQGCSPRMRRMFDPARYRAVLFDQRGCGRSTPHAGDPSTDLSTNTTMHLVDDLERLREHLGVERWLLCGGSWGATLALAYAERHPARVTAMVLTAIATSRRAEIEWLYAGGAARFAPEAWDRFRAVVPEAASDDAVLEAYERRLSSGDAGVCVRAADAWCAWEDAVLAIEPGAPAGARPGDASVEARVAFARITAHYAAHGAWLEDGALVRDAGRLAAIPGVLIHGRLDMGCPPGTAWALARAWPGSTLHLVEGTGHLGSEPKRALLLAALDALARE